MEGNGAQWAGASGRRTGPGDATVWRRSGGRLQQRDDLAGCCMPSKLRLLKDRNTVPAHFKTTTGTRVQRDLCIRKTARQLGRQTGGPGFVVSNRAVFDGNVHALGIRVVGEYSESAPARANCAVHNCPFSVQMHGCPIARGGGTCGRRSQRVPRASVAWRCMGMRPGARL